MSKLTAEQALELIEFQAPELLEVESLEVAKQKLSSEFIRKTDAIKDEGIANSIIGKRMGALDTFTNQFAKGLGIEFDETLSKAKIEDKLKFVSERTSTKFKENEELLKNAGGDEWKAKIEKEYNPKIESLTKQLQQKEEMLNNTSTAFDNFKSKTETESKSRTIKASINEAYSKVKISPEAKVLEIQGFKAMIIEKYEIGVDENGKTFVNSNETGKPIQNPKKMNEVLSLEAILMDEADKAGIMQKAPGAGKPVGGFQPRTDLPPSQGGQVNKRRHPSTML